jgi:hypothetical protein
MRLIFGIDILDMLPCVIYENSPPETDCSYGPSIFFLAISRSCSSSVV